MPYAMWLASLFNPIAQEVVQIWDVVDLVGCYARVVFDAAKRELMRLLNDIAGARVAIAWLAYGANVAHEFLLFEMIHVPQLIGRNEIAAFREYTRHVGMALKAAKLHHVEQLFDFLLIINIFREDVFIHGIARRAVHIHPFSISIRAGQGAQKIPTAVNRRPISFRVFELIAGPKDRAFGPGIETFGIEQRALIVVTQKANAGLLDNEIQAFARVGTIANDVAQAEDFFYALTLGIGQHGLETFQIAVNIANYGPFQFTARFGASGVELSDGKREPVFPP